MRRRCNSCEDLVAKPPSGGPHTSSELSISVPEQARAESVSCRRLDVYGFDFESTSLRFHVQWRRLLRARSSTGIAPDWKSRRWKGYRTEPQPALQQDFEIWRDATMGAYDCNNPSLYPFLSLSLPHYLSLYLSLSPLSLSLSPLSLSPSSHPFPFFVSHSHLTWQLDRDSSLRQHSRSYHGPRHARAVRPRRRCAGSVEGAVELLRGSLCPAAMVKALIGICVFLRSNPLLPLPLRASGGRSDMPDT